MGELFDAFDRGEPPPQSQTAVPELQQRPRLDMTFDARWYGEHSEVSDTQAIQDFGNLQIDAYGPGIHMNQYGQPVKLWPDFSGVPGEQLQITPNAYGPGVHMDQYGRPVREYPWP